MTFDPHRSDGRERRDDPDPDRSARSPSSARDDASPLPRIHVALSAFVVLALLRGVIPYTHRVHFGPLGAIRIVRGSDAVSLGADIARAAFVSFVEMAVGLFALVFCYVSLARVLGDGARLASALRSVLSRAYLLPLAGHPFLPSVRFGILWCLATWLGPVSNDSFALFALALGCVPLVPLVRALHANARAPLRAEAFASIALTLLPVVFAALAGDIVHAAFGRLAVLPSATAM